MSWLDRFTEPPGAFPEWAGRWAERALLVVTAALAVVVGVVLFRHLFG